MCLCGRQKHKKNSVVCADLHFLEEWQRQALNDFAKDSGWSADFHHRECKQDCLTLSQQLFLFFIYKASVFACKFGLRLTLSTDFRILITLTSLYDEHFWKTKFIYWKKYFTGWCIIFAQNRVHGYLIYGHPESFWNRNKIKIVNVYLTNAIHKALCSRLS